MGKSPAKWVRKILHRKKSPKSDSFKNAVEESSSAPSHVSSKVLSSNQAISDSASSNTVTEGNPEVEKERNVNMFCDESASGAISSHSFGLSDKAESHKLEVSATILQAALRASMARQAYRSLRGIVRLQALIRGHLVRRQAAATLHCVKGIVKLQAVVRGRMVRLSYVGVEVNKLFLEGTVQDTNVTHSLMTNSSTVLEKLPPNVFACKILALPISASPLHFQYDPTEPNSQPMWLERWSSSHFWGAVTQQKEVFGSAAHRKCNTQTAGAPPKRGFRSISAANVENTSHYMSSEHGKAKRYSRKPILSQQEEASQVLSEKELERVKRSLRKISLNSKESPQGKTEPSIETLKQRNLSPGQPQVLDDHDKGKAEPGAGISQQSVSNSSSLDVKEHAMIKSASGPDELKPRGEKNQKPDKGTVSESTLLVVHEPSDLSHNSLSTEQYSEDNGGNGKSIRLVNENSGREKHKSRRNSMQSNKQELHLGNAGSQSKPNLPSYMAATESAKRKLKGLGGTPRISMEGEEEDSSSRQYFLSTSVNVRLSSSVSPRILNLSHASEKDGLRIDRSLTSSRDSHGKVTRPGWRR